MGPVLDETQCQVDKNDEKRPDKSTCFFLKQIVANNQNH